MVWALVAVIAFSAFATAQIWSGIPQFSADMKMSNPSGGGTSGKLYFGGQRTRFEINSPRGEMIMINDAGKKVSYMVMTAQRMYMEMNGDMQAMRGRGPRMPDARPFDPNNPCSGSENYTCKKVGTETVNGRACDKWEFAEKNGSRTRTVWIDQKLHFPIKSTGSDGDTFELTNVNEGPQPASLFEVPAGYTKMDMGGMMGRRPQD